MNKGLAGRAPGEALNTRASGQPFCGAQNIATRRCTKTRRANAVFWQRKTLWLDVAKDKAVSRRQIIQYGKARPTQQRRIFQRVPLSLPLAPARGKLVWDVQLVEDAGDDEVDEFGCRARSVVEARVGRQKNGAGT